MENFIYETMLDDVTVCDGLIEYHIKTIKDGTKRTPTINSLIVLPYEILAINNETKGAHANHQVK